MARARDLTRGGARGTGVRPSALTSFARGLGRGTWAATTAWLLGAPLEPARAQSPQRGSMRIQPEVRADFIDARAVAAHLGLGATVAAGTYLRVAFVGAAGQAWRDGATEPAGRVDALARFVVDPLREFRWAPYASGGLSAMYDGVERWRAVLVGSLGVEGPVLRSVVPAVEIGFGGGTRVGVALRRSIPGRR